MKILAVDTSTKFLCLGLYDGRKVYEYNLEVGRNLSSLINVTIQRVMQAVGWQPEDIDYFALGLGPGSFTGIRVGVSTIKGMSWALKKPVIGIPSLDTLAKGIKDTDKVIIPAIDAKRNLVYCAFYKINKGALKRVTPYLLLNREDFLRRAGRGALVFGDAFGLHRDYWYPKAHNLIALALERIRAKKIQDAFRIKPIYLYPKECQVKKQ